MEVTNKMVHAAVKQAVKDRIIPECSIMEDYAHNWESIKRMIEKALEKEGQEF